MDQYQNNQKSFFSMDLVMRPFCRIEFHVDIYNHIRLANTIQANSPNPIMTLIARFSLRYISSVRMKQQNTTHSYCGIFIAAWMPESVCYAMRHKTLGHHTNILPYPSIGSPRQLTQTLGMQCCCELQHHRVLNAKSHQFIFCTSFNSHQGVALTWRHTQTDLTYRPAVILLTDRQ